MLAQELLRVDHCKIWVEEVSEFINLFGLKSNCNS